MKVEDLLASYTGKIIEIQTNSYITNDIFYSYMTKLANLYKQAGIQPGEPVSLLFSSSLQFLTHFFALLHAEAVPVILPKQTKPADWFRLREAHQLSALITSPINAHQFVEMQQPVAFAQEHIDAFLGHFVFLRIDHSFPQLSTQNAYIQPTSGSTGESKLCVRSLQAAVLEALNINGALQIRSNGNISCPLPLNHAFGFGSALMLSLITSADLYVMDDYHPRNLIRHLDRTKVDLLTIVPPMASFLEKTMLPHTVFPSQILSAGSPLDAKLYEQFFNKTGVAIRSAYGSTETGKISIFDGEGSYETGNVGRPLAHNMVRLVSKDAFQEIQVKTPSMMEGYLQLDGRLDAALDAEGWFATGDTGFYDHHGHLFLTGRTKHMINVFGVKVNPFEVCNVLKSMPGILDAHVYSGKHRSGSDMVQAIVSTSDKKTEFEIISYCKERLFSQKVPSRIFIVDQLPRSQTGKIITQQLPM